MSSPARGCEFSTATSGTERERDFVGIGACRSVPFGIQVGSQNYHGSLNKYILMFDIILTFLYNK